MRRTVLLSLFLVLAAAAGAFAQPAPVAPVFLGGAACPALSQAPSDQQPLWMAGGGGIAPDCAGQCYSEYLSCTPDFCCGGTPGCPYQLDCYEQYQECLRCCRLFHQTCTLC